MQEVVTVGVLVYWSLSGNVDLSDLEEAAGEHGVLEADLPSAPSMEVVLARAAQRCTVTQRQHVRPLDRRGSYAFVTEEVTQDGTGDSVLSTRTNVKLIVEGKGDEKRMRIESVTDDDKPLAEAIAAQVKVFDGLLVAADVSSWLLHVLERNVRAVSLRDRGGFYFVPADKVEDWRKYVGVIRSVSDHKLFEIPAYRSEEAVVAVSHSVREEAEAAMNAAKAYLSGEVSTRGLNSLERTLDGLREKLMSYAQLLAVNLEDLEGRATELLGACGAARLMKEEPNT